MDRDITLPTQWGKFNLRAGAIIICNNKLLMVKSDNTEYIYSVGGRIKMGESSEEAVLREVYEETGIHASVDRLGFIHENFFVDSRLGGAYHEIAFFYYIKDFDEKLMKCDSTNALGESESLCWLSLDKLDSYKFYPEFFKTHLRNPSSDTIRIVTRE